MPRNVLYRTVRPFGDHVAWSMEQLSEYVASNLRIVRKPLPSGRIVRRCDAPFPAGGTASHVRRRSRPFRPVAACAALRLTVKSAIPTAAMNLRGQNLPRQSLTRPFPSRGLL